MQVKKQQLEPNMKQGTGSKLGKEYIKDVYCHPVYLIYILSEVKLLSHVQLVVTPWTVAYHAPLYMGFSRQEYWSGLPFPFSEDLPHLGIEPRSPILKGSIDESGRAGLKLNISKTKIMASGSITL